MALWYLPKTLPYHVLHNLHISERRIWLLSLFTLNSRVVFSTTFWWVTRGNQKLKFSFSLAGTAGWCFSTGCCYLVAGVPGRQDWSVVFYQVFASSVEYFGGLITTVLTCFWTSVHMVTILLSAALLDWGPKSLLYVFKVYQIHMP